MRGHSAEEVPMRARSVVAAVAALTALTAAGGGVSGVPVAGGATPPVSGFPGSTALSPTLPASVLRASAAPGSTGHPERARYGTTSRDDIAVTMHDGTVLRVNVISPATKAGTPARGPFPVLLTQTPYGKGQGSNSAPGSAAKPGGASPTGGADDYLVERGYIEVVADVRGTGDSEGQWGLFDPVQTRDAVQLVRWAAHIPPSDGRVGTYGPSYLGINQLLLAGAIGPHSPLKAIFPVVSANDLYQDTSFMGGILDSE